MAIFEKEQKDGKSYVALLDAEGENLVAFITPVKQVGVELLVDSLKEKGLNVEVRESQPSIEKLKL